MLEFLLKYPLAAYQKGTVVLARPWPVWLLVLLLAAAAALVAWFLWSRRSLLPSRVRALSLGALQWSAIALLLLMLWQPALSVSTLEAHQNAIAVVVDTSRSMAIDDENSTRLEAAQKTLRGGLLDSLNKRFKVVVYEAGPGLSRARNLDALTATQPSTQLSAVLKQVASEASTLPLGGVVLISDGADNAGGVDRETIQALRAARLPVYTIGLGKETMTRDIEVGDLQLAARALPGARLTAAISIRQQGFGGKTAVLEAREDDKVVATKSVRLPEDGQSSRESLSIAVNEAGAHTFRIAIKPVEGEMSVANNSLARVVQVEGRKPRILFFEGEPRWELKFIRRAAELDKNLELVSMLRTTQNKVYRQGINEPKELADGFPTAVEELFAYDALIFGSVEAGAFTPSQRSLIREFADRRGGGVLFLGGRTALSDGGWQQTEVSEMLPVSLPGGKSTFHRDKASVALSPSGLDHPLTRLDEDPARNAKRWAAMPQVADYQEVGTPKPAATVLLEVAPPGRGRLPLLIVQPYGRGRVGVFATGGSWRWQMQLDSRDMSHETVWQQLLRWLISETPGRVRAEVSNNVVFDGGRVDFRAESRDRNYLPAPDAVVEARIIGPNGFADRVVLQPESASPGWSQARWEAPAPGAYLAEIVARRGDEEIGRSVVTVLREDGVAENFRALQDRAMLEQLANATGGQYHTARDAARIGDEVQYSEAGIARRDLKDLWDAPVFFLLLAALKAAEWLIRRRWGAV